MDIHLLLLWNLMIELLKKYSKREIQHFSYSTLHQMNQLKLENNLKLLQNNLKEEKYFLQFLDQMMIMDISKD